MRLILSLQDNLANHNDIFFKNCNAAQNMSYYIHEIHRLRMLQDKQHQTKRKCFGRQSAILAIECN